MTSILSSISGQFSKSLILSAFIPAVLFVLGILMFVAPLVPADWPITRSLETLDPQWQVVVVSLMTIVLSGFMYNINIPIIRFYEGYPWQHSWLGRRRTSYYQARLYALQARWKGMRTLLRAMPRDDPNFDPIRREWDRIGIQLSSDFPKKEHLVLPTRLGNVIRSFEDYPYRQYGMESITLWPRLIAKIDKDYAAEIGDARTGFDFMINSSILSALLALLILVSGLIYPIPFASLYLFVPWLLSMFGCCGLAYGFYYLSIGQARAWGELVKGAFDLYRSDLLKQLGHARQPATMPEERNLWSDIYQQMLYGDQPSIPLADYTPRTTLALAAPSGDDPDTVNFEITRGIGPAANGAGFTVTLMVKNVDARKRAAACVEVIDKLPDGFEYTWNSARCICGCRSIEVVGANPYTFRVGDLKLGESITFTYGAIPQKK